MRYDHANLQRNFKVCVPCNEGSIGGNVINRLNVKQFFGFSNSTVF